MTSTTPTDRLTIPEITKLQAKYPAALTSRGWDDVCYYAHQYGYTADKTYEHLIRVAYQRIMIHRIKLHISNLNLKD